ncbi:MAG: hypothetical protein FJX67_06645 [Alphaproteobacteria bacterium]|nr:hypothetical protein [Alphaproteobacteria bacterium]
MDRETLFAVISGICIVNGIFSPLVALPYALSPIWMPDFIPLSPSIAAYGSSLLLSFATLLVAGVPAAIYERSSGAGGEATMPMYVWLGATVALSLPALGRLVSL